MRVLVTGATGFIGSRVVKALLAQNHEVHALCRTQQTSPDVRWHVADLFDSHGVIGAVRAAKAQVLVHLAWIADPPAFWTSAENLVWLAASLSLVKAFVESGGHRMVIAGSCAEYGDGRSAPYTEGDRSAPTTLYGICKDALHSVVREYTRLNGAEYAWGRIFFVYGPGEPAQKLLSSLAAKMRGGDVPVLRQPDRKLDFVSVDDVASAFARLVNESYCGPINIASGTAVSVRDAATKIASIVAPQMITALTLLPHGMGGSDMLADTAQLSRISPPAVSFDDGIEELVASK